MVTKAMIVGSAAHTAMAAAALPGLASAPPDVLRENVAIGLPRQQGKTEAMTPTVDCDGLPNRLSIDRHSKHFTNGGNYVGVKFEGEEAPNVIEFCVSEGWVRRGVNPQVTRAEVRDAEREYGKVEVYWRSPPSRQVRRQFARMAR